MIDKKTINALLVTLEQDLNDLSDLSQTSRVAVELDQPSVGRLSRMDALQQQAMHKATEQKRQYDLSRIAMARQRLDSGEYGLCLECGTEIPQKRLEIDPIAEKCINCAEN